MKFIHIIAGLLALASGAVALYAAKGSWLHRKSGLVFVAAMWVMSALGAEMAAFGPKPNRISVVAGVLTFYLVSTSLLTVRRTVEQTRALLTAFMLIALMIAAFGFKVGIEAVNSGGGQVDGLPVQALLMFSSLALLGALLDARLLWVRDIQGAHRLARHLWRMTFAMWIATSSFFLGQAKFFPAPLRKTALLAIPVVLVLVLMFYWLARVLLFKRRVATAVVIAATVTEPRAT
ncbi:MAG: hypothetical protein ABIS07_03545 [Dokdonella sp.]